MSAQCRSVAIFSDSSQIKMQPQIPRPRPEPLYSPTLQKHPQAAGCLLLPHPYFKAAGSHRAQRLSESGRRSSAPPPPAPPCRAVPQNEGLEAAGRLVKPLSRKLRHDLNANDLHTRQEGGATTANSAYSSDSIFGRDNPEIRDCLISLPSL